MTRPRERRPVGPRPASAVDPEMLARYWRASRGATSRELVGSLRRPIDGYGVLAERGRHLLAMGAAVELLDVALRIATTPSPDAYDWDYKACSRRWRRPCGTRTPRVDLAAVDVERAPRTVDASTRH